MLYTVGCSFTYGHELEDRTKTAWPYLLGNLLHMDVVNLAISGVSNDYIMRTIITNVLSQTITSNDLVIVGWTGEFRKEFYNTYSQKYITLKKQRTSYVDESLMTFSSDKYLDDIHSVTTLFFDTFYNNSLIAINDKLQAIILLDSFLMQHNISHMFFNAVGNVDWKNLDAKFLLKIQKEQNKSIIESYTLRYSELQKCNNMILSPSMEQFCLKYPMGKYYHPLEEGHKEWTDFLYEQFISRFPEINSSIYSSQTLSS